MKGEVNNTLLKKEMKKKTTNRNLPCVVCIFLIPFAQLPLDKIQCNSLQMKLMKVSDCNVTKYEYFDKALYVIIHVPFQDVKGNLGSVKE